MSPGAQMDQGYCVHCGRSVQLRPAMGKLEPAPCAGCGKPPHDVLELLAAAGLLSMTMAICRGCGWGNRFHPFCFRCGQAPPGPPGHS